MCCSSFVSTVLNGRGGKEIGVLSLKYMSEDSDPDENDIPVAGRPQAIVVFIWKVNFILVALLRH